MNPKTPRPLGPSFLAALALFLLKTGFEIHLTLSTFKMMAKTLTAEQVFHLAKNALLRELTLFAYLAYIALAYFPIWGAWKAGWFQTARRTTKAREYLSDD